jgi:hypothetical protein
MSLGSVTASVRRSAVGTVPSANTCVRLATYLGTLLSRPVNGISGGALGQ